MMNDTSSVFEEPLTAMILKIVLYCVLFTVSFTGNILIIWAINRDNRLKSTTNILIANVAVSDLLVPLLSMPRNVLDIVFHHRIWLIKGDFGLALCKLAFFLQDVSMGVSTYSCVFIAIDRFYAVVYPLKGSFSRTKLRFIIPGIWIFTLAMFSPYLYSFTLKKTRVSTECTLDLSRFGISTTKHIKVHFGILFALTTAIPMTIVFILYLLIARKLRRNIVPGQTRNTAATRERQNKNALKMSAVIVSLFFLSWLPWSVFVLLTLSGQLDNLSPAFMNNLRFSASFIAESSCAYNFFIYLVFTEVYRQNFKKLFSKCSCFGRCSEGLKSNSFALEKVASDKQEVMITAIKEFELNRTLSLINTSLEFTSG